MPRVAAALVLVIALCGAGCTLPADNEAIEFTAVTPQPTDPGYLKFSIPKVARIDTPDESARSAYAFAADLALDAHVSNALVRLGRSGAAASDFKRFTDRLTPRARTIWRRSFTTSVADNRAYDDIRALAQYDIEDAWAPKQKVRVRTDIGLPVYGRKVTDPEVTRDGNRVRVKLVITGALRMTAPSGSFDQPYRVEADYELTSIDSAWYVDAWDADSSFAGVDTG